MKKLLLLVMVSLASLPLHAASKVETPPHVVAYLPLYKKMDNLVDLVKTMNWDGVTDIDLAFLNPPACTPACTAQSDRTFGFQQHSDADIDALVTFAHDKHIRVLAAIGGGGGSTAPVQAFYNAGLAAPLVASLREYVTTHKLDGVDVDIETPDRMGAPYAHFVDLLVHAMHADHKLLTAAVARYLQIAMPDAALLQFDWINVMAYTNYESAAAMMNFYAAKNVPRERIVLGVPFYGESAKAGHADYAAILAAYPNAWRTDAVSGGMLSDGAAFSYVGEDTMMREVELGKKFGGVMIWQALADAPSPHSLMDVVRSGMKSVKY